MSPTEEQSLRIAGLGRQVEEKARFFPSIPITFINHAV